MEWTAIDPDLLPPPIVAVYAQRKRTLHATHFRVRRGRLAYRVTSATGRTLVWSQKANGKWKARLA